jgi:hypothetical protein
MSRTPRLAALSTSWLVAVLVLACPLLARAAEPGVAVAKAQAEEALQQATSPRGAAHLLRLHSLKGELEDLTPLVSTYTQVLARRSSDPGARATAHLLLLDLERTRGRMVRAAEIRDDLGFLGGLLRRRWLRQRGQGGLRHGLRSGVGGAGLVRHLPGRQGP